MGFIGTGLVLYERNEVTPSSSSVAMEMVSMDTKEQGVGVSSEPSVHSEDSGIQSDWIWIEETWHPQVILSNSFDLLAEEPVPIHEPQVSYHTHTHMYMYAHTHVHVHCTMYTSTYTHTHVHVSCTQVH